MSKHFAMLTATRRLENHLSREHYNLNRMAENERIPKSLFDTKVGHHNELVDTLNELFANLTESPASELFARYTLDSVDDEEFSFISTESDVEEDVAVSPPVVQEPVTFDKRVVKHVIPHDDVAAEDESDDPVWKTEGYTSYDAWIADKEAEFVQDDLAIGVNDMMSRHRAHQALEEYSETSERDIASYLPEDDQPVSVLPADESVTSSDSGEDDDEDAYRYLDHTVDNVRVDSDPTQIAGVETAVERYGENSRRGTDIDVSSFLYQSDAAVVSDLISDDIEQLHTPRNVVENDA